MIYIDIDVAKDKHNCFIINSEGVVLYDVFTIQNDSKGFETLYHKIKSIDKNLRKTKVELVATKHYSYNLLGFLLDKDRLPMSSIRCTRIYTVRA